MTYMNVDWPDIEDAYPEDPVEDNRECRIYYGRSLGDAKKRAEDELGISSIDEVVELCSEREQTECGRGITLEEAEKMTRAKVPRDAFNVSEIILERKAESGYGIIAAYSEDEARANWMKALGSDSGFIVKSVSCVVEPSLGWLGFRKAEGKYRVGWFRLCEYCITFWNKASVKVFLK